MSDNEARTHKRKPKYVAIAIVLIIFVGLPATAVSLFVYGGLTSATKTCIATSDEYDVPQYGPGGGDYYYAHVNCSGQITTASSSDLHFTDHCYVKANDTVTVQFPNWYSPTIIGDNSC